MKDFLKSGAHRQTTYEKWKKQQGIDDAKELLLQEGYEIRQRESRMQEKPKLEEPKEEIFDKVDKAEEPTKPKKKWTIGGLK